MSFLMIDLWFYFVQFTRFSIIYGYSFPLRFTGGASNKGLITRSKYGWGPAGFARRTVSK